MNSAIYEGRIVNWKALGGENQAIQFYCPQPAKSAWERLAVWLYGDVRTAPLGKFELVGEPQEARDQVNQLRRAIDHGLAGIERAAIFGARRQRTNDQQRQDAGGHGREG